MQLDPTRALTPQLRTVSSHNLERLVAATLASVGYTVFRELEFDIGGQLAAKPDVTAVVFTPLRESRVFIECKGGEPSFKQIRQFASLKALVKPPPDDLVMVCKPRCSANRKELGEMLGVRMLERQNLVYYVLPLLRGVPARAQRAREINRYLAWQIVHDYFMERTGAHPDMKAYYRYLATELWRIENPAAQVDSSRDAYQTRFTRVSESVAVRNRTTTLECLRLASDDNVEAALYVSLLHRIMNVYAVVRRTLQVLQNEDTAGLAKTAGRNLCNAISLLSESPKLLYGFPSFLQTYFFVWGGFILDAERQWELEKMAEEADTTPTAVERYLDILAAIYTGTTRQIFQQNWGMTYFPYVPAAFRALGIRHRNALEAARYSAATFFLSSAQYDQALDRALGGFGGVAGLRYA